MVRNDRIPFRVEFICVGNPGLSLTLQPWARISERLPALKPHNFGTNVPHQIHYNGNLNY